MTAAPKGLRSAHLELIKTAPHDADLAAPPGLDEVEGLMWELARVGRSARATTMVRQHVRTGGKRLRARLALAATASMGGPLGDAIVWAAAVELLHNATLIHDDIQDGDHVRRGQPTLWSEHGVAQAMNAGDLMLMLPYLAVSRLHIPVRGELSAAIAEHAIVTVCGQVDELALLEGNRFAWRDYRMAVAGKTGALLALPVYGAALLSGRSSGQALRLSRAFSELGVMFQLQDDVLDLYGDKGRDKIGSDLYEGKVSALVVAHLERRTSDRDWLLDVLRAPRENTRPADVKRAIDSFARFGALGTILDRIDYIAARIVGDPDLAEVPALRSVAVRLVGLATKPIHHCRALTQETAHE